MRLIFTLLLASVFVAGCSQPSETVPTVGGGSSTSGVTDDAIELDTSSEAPPSSDGASTTEAGAVRFVANTSLEIPNMMCPYGCYPAVEETLATLEGVEGVQLAEQPKGTPEGQLRKKVVELKVGEGFDLNTALAALKAAKFEAQPVN